jgi:DNA invertase Pin-like site-specific DNA recombinase
MLVRAAIYARTSPDCLLSIDKQIEELTRTASDNGWSIVRVFADRPMTVRKGQDRRPGEVALLDAIRSGAIDRVLIHGIDRIGKSLTELVGFLETCRAAGVALWLDREKLDTAGCNGVSLFDVAEMMAHHLRQSRRDKILRGQSAARALSIKFGRPSIPAVKVNKAKQELAIGKGVRQVARLCGISPASVCRIKNSMSAVIS